MGWPVFEANAGPVKVIEHFGTEALKKRIIPEVCKGEKVVAVSMSEPGAGTGLTDLKTKAEIKGDKIVINGNKRWCSELVTPMDMLCMQKCQMLQLLKELVRFL